MRPCDLRLSERDRGWLELRERLARAAREIHFVAVGSDAVNGPALLEVAENLATLAISIPLKPDAASSASDAAVECSSFVSTELEKLSRKRDEPDGG